MPNRTFQKRHFQSGDGMMTAVWGPSLWHTLHTISFNYPLRPTKADKHRYKTFMMSLSNVLPCAKCRSNLGVYYASHPLTAKCLSSRAPFSMYVYKLHERVNKLLGKQSGLTYCDVRERYEHFRARCDPKSRKTLVADKEAKGKGCSDALHGKKAKCILSIVPASKRCKTMNIHSSCLKKRRTRRR